MQIKGRGRFTGTLTATPAGYNLRIDDVRDPAFWLEIDITDGEWLKAAEAYLLSEGAKPVSCRKCNALVTPPADYVAEADGGWGVLCESCDQRFAEVSILPERCFPAPF